MLRGVAANLGVPLPTRHTPVSAHAGPVPGERPIAVELEIDAAHPLSGRLREHDGPWHGFAGWIGLAGALDGVLAEPRGTDDRDSSGTRTAHADEL